MMLWKCTCICDGVGYRCDGVVCRCGGVDVEVREVSNGCVY